MPAVAGDEKHGLILTGLSTPEAGGLEDRQRLRIGPASAAIPVSALSAHAMRGREERAWAAGGDGLLTWRVDENVLFEKIARQIGN